MRDPARIPRILERLQRYWLAHPDLRLGQILCNVSPHRPDPFYVEDATTEGWLDGKNEERS